MEPLALRVAAALADLVPGERLLVAVSGGADSVALLHLLLESRSRHRLDLGVVHLDHGLHPDSSATRRFVEDLAVRVGLPCRAERADVLALAAKRRLGLEEAGRAARHELFTRAARAEGARAVALAHTRDDRAETLLLNLVRGAGTAGLAAMRPVAFGLLRRPLLAESREALRRYLAAIGEPHVEDPTNRDPGFARNRIRLEVLPALGALNPRAVESLARAAALLAADEDWLDAEAERALPTSVALDARALAALPDALARRAARRWLLEVHHLERDVDHGHIDAVLELARRRRGAHATDLPGGLRLRRAGDSLLLVPAAAAPGFSRSLALDGDTAVPEASLVLHVGHGDSGEPPASGSRVRLPARALGPGARVRSPAPGDRFQPLGSSGARRLSRYLIDRKVPRHLRSRTALVEGEAGILWVVGEQVGENARLAPGEPFLTFEARVP